MVDRLKEITGYYNPNGTDFGLTRYQIDWLIKEIERLRIIEQAYEGMKKAL